MRYEEWDAVRRVLAVRTGAATDVLLLAPALRALKGALPGVHLTLLTSSAGQAAAELLPWVDKVVVHEAVWDDQTGARTAVDIDHQLDLVELMEAEQCDAAAIFTSATQSPWPAAYAAYLARVPLRLGQSREAGGALLTHTTRSLPDDAHEIDRNLFLLETAGLPVAGRHLELHVPEAAQAAVERLLVRLRIPPGEPYAVVSPGVTAPSRRYPVEFHAEVCRSLTTRTGLPVVVVGTRASIRLAAQIVAENAGTEPGGAQVASVAGQTSLTELAALVQRANVVITNPTVVMHLADAFRRPTVVTFTAGTPTVRWRPRAAPATLLQLPASELEDLEVSASVVTHEAVRRLEHASGWTPTTAAGTLALEPQTDLSGSGDEDAAEAEAEPRALPSPPASPAAPAPARPDTPAPGPAGSPFEEEIPIVTSRPGAPPAPPRPPATPPSAAPRRGWFPPEEPDGDGNGTGLHAHAKDPGPPAHRPPGTRPGPDSGSSLESAHL